jgi:hypothetical protein
MPAVERHIDLRNALRTAVENAREKRQHRHRDRIERVRIDFIRVGAPAKGDL